MAVVDQRHLKEISELVDSLDGTERRKLLYLCGSLETDASTNFVKEFLKSKYLDSKNGTLFLMELLWRLERFDILKVLYKVSRKDVADNMKYTQVLSKFRVLMVSISDDLDKEDLDKIKFLLSTTVSRQKMNAAETFLDVLIELEKLDSVSAESVDNVHKCFMNVGRVDLAKKIVAYKMSGQHVSQPQSCKTPEIAQWPTHHNARGSAPFPVSREPSSRTQLEKYNFNTYPRGVCVIIDCVGNGGEMLEQTFCALRFKVIPYKWLSSDEILSVLKGIFSNRENHPGDGFVCCIISRGTVSSILGTDSKGSGIATDCVRRLFTADACPILIGKPKLFFIQTYCVPEHDPCPSMSYWDDNVEPDGCNGPIVHNTIPVDADIFWSHCWTDEHQLEKAQQSIYLKALTEYLRTAQRRKDHLFDAHMEVNSAIFKHNKIHPEANYHIVSKHTLRKSLFLD